MSHERERERERKKERKKERKTEKRVREAKDFSDISWRNSGEAYLQRFDAFLFFDVDLS